MKIVFNSSSNILCADFFRLTRDRIPKSEILTIKAEKALFEEIAKDNSDAYIIENYHSYSQKAVDFIKKKNPYAMVIILMVRDFDKVDEWVKNADIYLFNPENSISNVHIQESILRAIESYKNSFSKLHSITAKIKEEIHFAESLNYDPVRRDFRFNNVLVKKMTPKEGGVLEVLAMNYGKIVKKEIIMERVWHSSSFYIGRSMDVYLTNLRNLFKEKGIPLSIKNIHNGGLILEHNNN